MTGYNAIYGSFAALPLFMIWMQISWTICLFGAQLTYTNQNLNRFGINLDNQSLPAFWKGLFYVKPVLKAIR